MSPNLTVRSSQDYIYLSYLQIHNDKKSLGKGSRDNDASVIIPSTHRFIQETIQKHKINQNNEYYQRFGSERCRPHHFGAILVGASF